MSFLPLRIILFSLCYLLSGYLFSQKAHLFIQPGDKKYPGSDFTIIKITDNRPDKDNIGIIYKSDATAEHFAVFKHPLEVEVLKFYNKTYTNRVSDNKIILVINSFEIGHLRNKHAKDSGYVFMNMDIYLQKNDSIMPLSQYTKRLCEAGNEIPQSHPNRMKRALLLAANAIEQQLKDTALVRSLAKQSVSETKTIIPGSTINSRDLFIKDSIALKNNYPHNTMLLVGGQATLGSSYNLFGGSVCYMAAFKRYPRQFLGVHINYSAIKFKEDVHLPSNVSTYKIKSSDIGLRYLGQVKKALFFNAAGHAMLGAETFEYKIVSQYNPATIVSSEEKSTFFWGAQVDFGLWLIPPVGKGFFAGTDVMFRVTNSIVFNDDTGVRFSAGFKF